MAFIYTSLRADDGGGHQAYIKMGRMEEAINLMKQALQNPVPRATPAEIADYKVKFGV